MSEPLINDDKNSVAEQAKLFTAMAEKMQLNGENQFGGAFVVVPPVNGGAPIQTLILDAAQDPAQFWGILKVKCDIMLATIDDRARAQSGGFRR